jgi:hypothetical protein
VNVLDSEKRVNVHEPVTASPPSFFIRRLPKPPLLGSLPCRRVVDVLVERLQYLFRPGANADVFRQVSPVNCSGRIDEELGRARDVGALRSRAGMKHIVAPNRFRLWIGEKRVAITHLLAMAPIGFRRVNADRNNANPARPELGKLLLETPQLGVTEGSPKSSIKNEQNGIRLCRRSIG